MSNLYGIVVQLFYQLANAFFWPVAIILLVLLTYSMIDLGRLWYAMWRRRHEPRTDLSALGATLAERLAQSRSVQATGLLDGVRLSPALRRFWAQVQERLRGLESTQDLDLWLDEVLRGEEIDITTRLDRSRAFIRIGPMLGLSGTIIPLGPALQALLGGDIAGMVSHLVVGFGAVVCGLVLSGIAYYITLVRERWARIDIKDMEDLCELLMRHVKRYEEKGEQPLADVRSA